MANQALPIAAFRDKIVEAVRENSVTIIVAETGAGKSTQVPQYLLAEGWDLVVTEPRRLAARTVSARVAEEFGENLGGIVGYRTAVDRQDSPATRCLFCTDGLALVRELMGQNRGILVLDEVHEWNENMEVLVAWAKRQVEEVAGFKVVLMSATLEAEKLSAFFKNAPVISVPGRQYPVEAKQPGYRLEDDVASLVREGRNVLVFQPGKREIGEIIAALVQLGLDAEILPLHGELEPFEQARCFAHYGRPKVVVSTNVAQTSVTIDDIDAVVDSGTERRIELVDGVEGLYLKSISLADSAQRKGRAGRTKPGVYIDHCGASVRPEFPVAEILRKRLDQTVLRLAIAGFDMEELPFFHQPDIAAIRDAKRALIALGCMTQSGEVTRVGRLVNRLPVSVQYARMLVEADRLGVVDDVLSVAAIMEMGGITVPPPSRSNWDRPDWRRMVPAEHESDVMGQLAVYKMAGSMTKEELREKGVSLRSYFRAQEIRRLLAQALGRFFQFGSTGRREDILKAVCAGMVDHLYRNHSGSLYNGGSREPREIGASSLVREGGGWVVGKPFDLQITTRRGQMTLKLIELASKVDPAWLAEVAPQLVEQKTGLNPRYDTEKDVVVSTTQTFFNGVTIGEETVADGENPEAAAVFACWLASQRTANPAGSDLDAVLRSNAERQERARQLNMRAGEEAFQAFSQDEIVERFVNALMGARRIVEVSRPEALALPALDEELVARILSENPDTINVLGADLAVEYRQADWNGKAMPPRVKLTEEMVKANSWIRLPDEGVRIPGGRLVEIVVVSRGYYNTISGIEIPLLKAKVREYLNQERWDLWTDRPAIEIPDSSAEGSEVPFITACYGKCVVTGEELAAYGTAAVNTSRWYSSDPWFKAAWYRDPAEAEKARAEAAQKLEAIRAEARRQRELEAAKAEAESAREELRGLSRRDGWYDLDYELRRKAEDRWYASMPNSTEEVRRWTVEAKAIVAEEEQAIADLKRQREEDARAKAEAERVEAEELAVILREIGEDNLAEAREAKAFAEAVERILGARKGAQVLRGEAFAPYGRARRQEAISWKVSGIAGTDAGQRFLSLLRASDVDARLTGASAWLEAKLGKSNAKSAEASDGFGGEETAMARALRKAGLI